MTSTPSLAWRALALLLMVAVDGAQADEPRVAGPRAPRTFALLVGCTEYPRLEQRVSASTYRSRVRLQGSVRDVELLRRTLLDHLGVQPGDVAVLAGWPDDPAARPTRENVVRALEALAARAYVPGDRVLVHYSGHGVQQPDLDGDELDGRDEAWALADVDREPRGPYVGTLSDDDLGRLLGAIRDRHAFVWCVMDCCHSGTALRSDADAACVRHLPEDLFGPPPRDEPTRGDAAAVPGEPGRGLVALYAAQSDQEVPEVSAEETGGGRAAYGLLSSCVARALARSGARLTFRELYERVVAGYRDWGVSARVQPLAEGEVDAPVLPGGAVHAASALAVRRLAPGRLELSAGRLHGVAPGTEVELFAPGRLDQAAGRIGRVVVTSTRPEVSVVAPVTGSDDAWTRGADAVWSGRIAKHVVGAQRRPLRVRDARGRSLGRAQLTTALLAVLDASPTSDRHPLLAGGTGPAWELLLDEGGEPRGLTGPTSATFGVTRSSLADALATLYRGENLRWLARHAAEIGATPPAGLEVLVRRADAPGGPRLVAPGERVPPGSHLEVLLVREPPGDGATAEPVDLHVFWLDPHGGVTLLYPNATQGGPRLGPHDLASRERPLALQSLQTADDSQGEESVLWIAAGTRQGAPHTDLGFLTQPPLVPLRAASDDSATRLLTDLAQGAAQLRGDSAALADGPRLGAARLDLVTRWGALHVPRDAPHEIGFAVPPPAAPGLAPDALDAWDLGTRARLVLTGDGGAAALVAAGAQAPRHVLLDLDGEVPAGSRDPASLERLTGARAFGADVALRRAGSRQTVWYDTEHDGTFDLALVDLDGDLIADERWRRRTGSWVREGGLPEPVLSTAHLAWLNGRPARAQAFARLRTFSAD